MKNTFIKLSSELHGQSVQKITRHFHGLWLKDITVRRNFRSNETFGPMKPIRHSPPPESRNILESFSSSAYLETLNNNTQMTANKPKLKFEKIKPFLFLQV